MRRLLIAAIDRYRARVTPHCTVCQSTPDQSFSYQVRQQVVERGVLAGLLMLFVGWLAHLSGAGWGGPQRFSNGGW